MAEKYTVTVPLEGFKLTVTTDASNPIDARRAAIDLVTFKFPLVVNSSEEFKIAMMVVGDTKKPPLHHRTTWQWDE